MIEFASRCLVIYYWWMCCFNFSCLIVAEGLGEMLAGNIVLGGLARENAVAFCDTY